MHPRVHHLGYAQSTFVSIAPDRVLALLHRFLNLSGPRTCSGGGPPVYWKQENEKERRIVMLYNVAIGILVVFFSVLLSVNLVQVVRTIQNRYRQTMRAVDQANMTALEIQRLLANRSLRFKGWQ